MADCFESLAKSLVSKLLEKHRSEINYYHNKLEETTQRHKSEIEEREKQHNASIKRAKLKILFKSEENKKLRELLHQHNILVPSLGELIEIKTITETSKDSSSLTTPIPSPNRRSLRLSKPKKHPIYHDRPHPFEDSDKPHPLDDNSANSQEHEYLMGVSQYDNNNKEGVVQDYYKEGVAQDYDKEGVAQDYDREGVAQDYDRGGVVQHNDNPIKDKTKDCGLVDLTRDKEGVVQDYYKEGVVMQTRTKGATTWEEKGYESDKSDITVCSNEVSNESILLFTSCYHGNNEEMMDVIEEEEESRNSPSLICKRIDINNKNTLSCDPRNVSHDRSHGPPNVSHDRSHDPPNVSHDRSHGPPNVSHDRSHDPTDVSHDRSHDFPIRSHDSRNNVSLNKKRRKSCPEKSKKIKQSTMTQHIIATDSKPHPLAPPTDNDVTIIGQVIPPHVVPPTPFIGPTHSVYNWNKGEHNLIENRHDNKLVNNVTSIGNQRQPQSNTVDNEKTSILSREQEIALRAGLPTYKCTVNLKKREDRQKLTAVACPECTRWFKADNGLYDNVKDHLQKTCRHRHLYLPPDSDPSIWNIGFPDESINNES